MLQTSERDQQILITLRNDSMIDELPEGFINQYDRAVHIMCCDPFRFTDATNHICAHLRREGKYPVVMPLSFLGGALILSPDSPVLPENSTMARDWLNAIALANEEFDIRVVLGHAHVPCKMAYGQNIDAFRLCEMSLATKKRVEAEVPGVEYIPLIHTAHFRGDRMLTYLIRKEVWDRKIQQEMMTIV